MHNVNDLRYGMVFYTYVLQTSMRFFSAFDVKGMLNGVESVFRIAKANVTILLEDSESEVKFEVPRPSIS